MIPLLAAVDVDQLTDYIGLPVAFSLIGLLLLLDVKRIDPESGPVLAVLANRRATALITGAVAVAFLAIVALRVRWLAA